MGQRVCRPQRTRDFSTVRVTQLRQLSAKALGSADAHTRAVNGWCPKGRTAARITAANRHPLAPARAARASRLRWAAWPLGMGHDYAECVYAGCLRCHDYAIGYSQGKSKAFAEAGWPSAHSDDCGCPPCVVRRAIHGGGAAGDRRPLLRQLPGTQLRPMFSLRLRAGSHRARDHRGDAPRAGLRLSGVCVAEGGLDSDPRRGRRRRQRNGLALNTGVATGVSRGRITR